MMDAWLHLVGTLPFDWVEYDFMKIALLAVLLVTPVFGILGTMVVNNRMAFFSEALGHSAFTGIAIGVLMGIMSPTWSMMLFAIVFSALLLLVKNSSRASTDTIIGVFSSTAVALGLVLLSWKSSFAKYQVYLIGNLLGITADDILPLLISLAGVLLLWVLVFNKLLISGINEPLARSRGIPVRPLEVLFTMVIAIVVTLSIQWVGLLIINSLLILPAAAARNISRNVRQYHIVSVLVAVFSGVAGLISSFYLETASGPTIVLFCAVIYFITFAFKGRFA